MGTEEKIRLLENEWADHQRGELYDHVKWCESPIERLLLMAMMVDRWEVAFSSLPYPESFPESAKRGSDSYVVYAGPLAELVPRGAYGAVQPPTRDLFQRGHFVGMIDIFGLGDVYLFAQLAIGASGRSYRADFAFVGEKIRLIVEADGHGFHERTKEQAQRDKSRDRALQVDGWKILRFTGAEIYADAKRCASDVAAVLTLEGLKHAPPPEPTEDE